MCKLNLIFAATNACVGNYWLATFCLVAAVAWVIGDKIGSMGDED